VIYTSGSTGKPKGVMIEHRCVVNLSADQIRRFSVTPQDRVLQFSSLSFDASVYELFMALLSGAALVLINERVIRDEQAFTAYLQEKSVTMLVAPPSYLAAVDLERLDFLRVLVTGGEDAIPKHALQCSRFAHYYNSYGPTECTVAATTYAVSGADAQAQRIPIGKPIANTQVYILDQHGQLVPLGVEGEICIGGAGLARGYLNQPALTREKFIPNPFAPGERLYRTGDTGRFTPGGDLEFLGRKDKQVKLRGYRIELGEIESALLSHALVTNAAAKITKSRNGESHLTAYVAAKQNIEPAELRLYLKKLIPDYMVPAYLAVLPELPVTTSGKVDVQALPDIEAAVPDYIPPGNEAEENIVLIWEQVLEKAKIGVNNNFFEIGGDSLKLMKVYRLLSVKYPDTLQVTDLFKYHTVQLLGQFLNEKSSSGTSGTNVLVL
jgi:acyl-coenzyme A synthetase/AMP-(fatty) acid ligase